MNKLNKLMIITSANGDEYGKYWGLRHDHPIVKDGYDGVHKIVFETPDLKYFEEEVAPELSNYLVMIHYDCGQEAFFSKKLYHHQGKEIQYYIFYYSTLDPKLKVDLWSIGEDYLYAGPKENPTLPFDKLRSDIIQQQDYSKSVDNIISWAKNKVESTSDVNDILDLLHICMKKENAVSLFHQNKFAHISLKDQNISALHYIKENLIPIENQEEYYRGLDALKKALM